MKTAMAIVENKIFITDYEKNSGDANPLDIRIYRWNDGGDRCSMFVGEKFLPLTSCRVEELPSGNVRLAITLDFPEDLVFFEVEVDESP